MAYKTQLVPALLFVAGTAIAGDAPFAPLWNPAWECNTETNTGEWLRPNLGAAKDIIPLKTRIYATKEAVTDGVAMKIIFEKGSTGILTFERARSTLAPPAHAVCESLRAGQVPHLHQCRPNVKPVRIGTDWKKYDFPFKDIEYNNDWWQILFQVMGPIENRTWLILDRIGVENPAFDPNPKIEPTSGPDETISSQDILYGAENLAKTLERLKAKKPFKVYALGIR